MKKTYVRNFLFSITFLLFSLSTIAQSAKKVLKVQYTSSPVNQYIMTDQFMESSPTKASLYDFLAGIVDYYSLYVNLEDQSSIYIRDSTTHKRPTGWGMNVRGALADTVLFALKNKDNQTYKHEWIMNQIFFSEGKVGDIKWELQTETKDIEGLKCFKAVSLNYPMLTVWYTKEIPLVNGPSIFQGVPGLVLWAEDYFRTVNVLDISYSDDLNMFNALYADRYQLFEKEKERKKNYDKEPLVLIKKGDLALSNYKYFQNKPYKPQ